MLLCVGIFRKSHDDHLRNEDDDGMPLAIDKTKVIRSKKNNNDDFDEVEEYDDDDEEDDEYDEDEEDDEVLFLYKKNI